MQTRNLGIVSQIVCICLVTRVVLGCTGVDNCTTDSLPQGSWSDNRHVTNKCIRWCISIDNRNGLNENHFIALALLLELISPLQHLDCQAMSLLRVITSSLINSTSHQLYQPESEPLLFATVRLTESFKVPFMYAHHVSTGWCLRKNCLPLWGAISAYWNESSLDTAEYALAHGTAPSCRYQCLICPV